MLINGIASREIDIQDRGLQYGDGLFETIAVRDGIPLRWEHHMQRLLTSCERLKLPLPDEPLLRHEVEQLIRSNAADRAVIKILYTRGTSQRGYKLPEPTMPTRVISLSAWPDFPENYYRQGIQLCICETRLGSNSLLAGMKHLNRLEQVLARAEWDDAAIAEGIMCDQTGNVIEGTMSNLFLVRQGALYTPSLDQAGVAGVMREAVLDSAEKLAIQTHIATLTMEDVLAAEEVFMTNSLIGIWPVQSILMDPVHILRSPGLITQKIQVELGA